MKKKTRVLFRECIDSYNLQSDISLDILEQQDRNLKPTAQIRKDLKSLHSSIYNDMSKEQYRDLLFFLGYDLSVNRTHNKVFFTKGDQYYVGENEYIYTLKDKQLGFIERKSYVEYLGLHTYFHSILKQYGVRRDISKRFYGKGTQYLWGEDEW